MAFERINSLDKEKIELVATNVPEGLIVHTELGISKRGTEGPSINEFQREKLTGKNLRLVHANEVGLEWRDANGQKIKESDPMGRKILCVGF
jgi:hypothetical protein